MDIFDKLIDDFNNSSAWLEFFIVVGGLLLAYVGVRWWGASLKDKGRASAIWFGHRPVSGAMFPLLALLLIYSAQLVVTHYMPVFWLRVAVSLLFSLTIIRFVARVLSKTFPQLHQHALAGKGFFVGSVGCGRIADTGATPRSYGAARVHQLDPRKITNQLAEPD